MAEQRAQRRLAAILAADVAGYSRLMGVDEEGTLARLNTHRREFLEPTIAEHRGRIVKRTGDGILIEFASAVDATRCAVQSQRGMLQRNAAVPADQRIEIRIGIHVGDIIIEEGDIFGDGVNIAARLENLAQPNGICISDDTYRQVRGKIDANFEDAGVQELKNIAQPLQVYRLQTGGGAAHVASPALPDKPSVAVLPFQNMSGDPEQEYFADGMVEEIITALSRIPWLFVIARNSSFTYKGRPVDVKQVGRELGVRYVLEGSVRKAANRVRITGQLIDVTTNAHLWAERFDGTLEDIFHLQDDVATSVAGAIAPRLQQAEIERAKCKRTESLDAYDYFLRGMASHHQWTRQGTDDALRLFYKAIELDPNFPSAFGMAAYCYVWRRANGWMTEPARELAEAARLATRAVELGRDDSVALCLGGFALARAVGDLDRGADFIDQALVLNPNLATAWGFSGRVRVYRGEPDLAINHLARAMRLSPRDPEIYGFQGSMAYAHLFAGRYEEASSWADKAMRENAKFLPVTAVAAASHALAGHSEKAWVALESLCRINPMLRIGTLHKEFTFKRVEDMARLAEGLRLAGLPT
jgi:TolB-like protein/class 3 adenylate cyclase